MKKYNICMVLLFLIVSSLYAERSKEYKTSFKVSPNMKINIETVSGMNVKVMSWDSNQVKVDLKIEISSSDDEYEKEYIKQFSINERRNKSELSLVFNEPDRNGWSFWDIFKLKFSFYVNKEIRGVIYVPRSNALAADFRYSEIILDGLKGELDLPGRSNKILLKNCENVQNLENEYGETEIIGCKGNLELLTRSSTLKIKNFTGEMRISADYNDVFLEDISGHTKISSRSGNMEVKNINGNLDVDAPYMNMKIYDVNGFTRITNRSENILVSNSKGLTIDGPYCTMDISGIEDIHGKKISITGRSGSISLTKITGDINVDDQYSKINLSDVKGNIDLTSRSETITGSSIEGNIYFETQYCEIRIEKLNAREIKMLNRSGEIRLNMISNPSEVKIKNEYGEVELSLLKSYEGEFDLNANYGKVITTLPLRIRESGSSEFGYGKIGKKNNKIEIETRSENIVINNKKE